LLLRGFFDRPAVEVAPELLGCVIEHETPAGLVAVALTEVEAYEGAADPASHAYRGQTRRNAVMFGRSGHAYVYFTYGMHFCVNLVCRPAGTAAAVLLRAGAVIEGQALARERRGYGSVGRPDRDLARGPARLCQALGVDRSLDGADVCDPASPIRVRDALRGPPSRFRSVSNGEVSGRADVHGKVAVRVRSGPRVGVRDGAAACWRFWIDGEATVSRYRAWSARR